MTTREANAALVRQFLSFVVGGTDFGVPILKVKEILQYEGVTRVPGTPGSIRGVINVRGSVVPVVDLGVKFGKGEVPETKRTCVLVVETKTKDETLTIGVGSPTSRRRPPPPPRPSASGSPRPGRRLPNLRALRRRPPLGHPRHALVTHRAGPCRPRRGSAPCVTAPRRRVDPAVCCGRTRGWPRVLVHPM